MDTYQLMTIARETIETIFNTYDGDIPQVAIFPFGKDGLIVKNVLNQQFGKKETYLADNQLYKYNTQVISLNELLAKKEELVVILSTTNKENNLYFYNLIKESGNKNLKVFNIADPIISEVQGEETYYNSLRDVLHVRSVKNNKYIRVGRFNDGGYSMIDDFDDKMRAYSFGINDDMSWDKHLNSMSGMRVDMYDHTIPCAPDYQEGCFFHRIGIGDEDNPECNLMEFSSILGDANELKQDSLILKMDIEGAEWDVLESVPEFILKCFRQMVFEFHGLNTANTISQKKIINVLKKLGMTHQVAWVHGNNYTSAVRVGNMTIPDAIEVLFVSRSCYNFSDEGVRLPLKIDMPNMRIRKDYDLSFLSELS